MDPNLFAIDWGQLGEALTVVIVLSFLVERALALIFENRHVEPLLDSKGVKDVIAFGVAFGVCYKYDFDILAITMRQSEMDLFGIGVTAAVIAGGSKASIKLFHDVMGVKPPSKGGGAPVAGGGGAAGGSKPAPAGGGS